MTPIYHLHLFLKYYFYRNYSSFKILILLNFPKNFFPFTKPNCQIKLGDITGGD